MQFRVVWDQLEECPYRPGQVARLPLRVPIGQVSADGFDKALAEGERRSGRMLYRTQCPTCHACEPLRIPVARFSPTESQKRARKRNADVTVEVGKPALTYDRLKLYNRHKAERGLSTRDEPLTPQGYRNWLVDTCADTREVRYFVARRLVAISILDIGRRTASSVYHYFDPDEAKRSLGVFSVVRELELCAEAGLEWYYLGFYVEDCRHLAYKGSYWPHQRLIEGEWREFTGPVLPAPGP